MTKNELDVLKKILSTSKKYLEFGAGTSTEVALSFGNIKTLHSVESSLSFIQSSLLANDLIHEAIDKKRLNLHYINIGETVNWGYPKDSSHKALWPNYAKVAASKNIDYDAVLIDGRFRITCALNVLLSRSNATKIIIHDFWNRNYYHEILNFVDVSISVDTLGVFTKRTNFDINLVHSLLLKHQFDPR